MILAIAQIIIANLLGQEKVIDSALLCYVSRLSPADSARLPDSGKSLQESTHVPRWVAAGVEPHIESTDELKGSVESRGSVDGVLQKPKPAGVPVRVVRARKKTSTQPNPPTPPETLQDRTLAEAHTRPKRLNIDPKVFGEQVSQMKTNSVIRADLKKLG
jgi:hypothetical protein